jgi:predicted Mrr-cat superfamily restriction endonuclease
VSNDPQSSPKAWIVRAGEDSRYAESFASADAIAIGWNDIPGIGDLRELEQPEIEKLLRAVGRSAGVASADAREMIDFRDGIQVNDVVVTPDSPAREILVGDVSGEYEFRSDAPLGDYRHVRTVSWVGRYGRDSLSPELHQDTRYRRTIRLLDARPDQWLALAAEMRAGDPVSVLARRGTQKRVQARRAAAREAPTAATQRCPGCGLGKAVGQFVDGSDLCVDCRDA